MRLTHHFTLAEMTVSQTAARLGIGEQFAPPQEIINNLISLASQLEVVRVLLGSTPIVVSSAYRCARLNDTVEGSSKSSAHMKGLAADFTAHGFGSPLVICRRLLATTHIEFDQIICEYGQWVHFAIGPEKRRQALSKFAGDPKYHVGILDKPPAEPLVA